MIYNSEFKPGTGWRTVVIVMAVTSLVACKSSGGGNKNDPSYQSARTLPPLDVPPDLSQFPPSAEYNLPATEQRVAAAGQEPGGSQPPVSEEIQARRPGIRRTRRGRVNGI